jgi:hypothetical protein
MRAHKAQAHEEKTLLGGIPENVNKRSACGLCGKKMWPHELTRHIKDIHPPTRQGVGSERDRKRNLMREKFGPDEEKLREFDHDRMTVSGGGFGVGKGRK